MPNAMSPTITIGADPELFVRDKKTGRLVSAHNLMPGTKLKPHPVTYGALQVDGVAAEINITPAADAMHFVHNNQQVMSELSRTLGPAYELVIEPVGIFEGKYFETLPTATRELGCNPDFNGWTGEMNDPPVTADGNEVMRSAAGHVHIGGWAKDQDVRDKGHFVDCCTVAKQMDYFLGIWTLLWDPDPRRRSLYGKAGAFRPKSYGMEYRTPSNMWLVSDELQAWVCNAAQQGMYMLFNSAPFHTTFGDRAREIIDNNVVDWASDKKNADIRRATGLMTPPVPKTNAKKRLDPAHAFDPSTFGTGFANSPSWASLED